MFSCKFLIPHAFIDKLNDFIDQSEISNLSIFENPGLGFSEDLDDLGFPVAKFFNVEIFKETQEDSKKLESELKSEFQDVITEFKIDLLNNQDWIELYTKELTPVLCDKFYFYNEALQESTDNSELIPIKLNSALAFGSGHHQTTKGCLLNLAFLNDLGFAPKNILDMGCGTGILGICAKKLWQNSELLGIDIDNDAAIISQSNYIANDIIGEAIQGSNVDFLIKNEQKFDLILCNILKQPLIDLCSDFFKIINDTNGYIITSGYIKNQESEVVACYLSNNFELINKIYIEDWASILFKKKK